MAVRVVRGHEPDRDAVLPELCERTLLSAQALVVCQTGWRRAGREMRILKPHQEVGTDATEVARFCATAFVPGKQANDYLAES